MGTCLNLAICKIGDLLLSDKITADKKGEPIDDISLIIPNYQRPYKWTAKNVIQLLDDIINAKNENKEIYRVGTLILHKEKKEEKEKEKEKESKYNIVDGQQRTISFSLLLKALEDNNSIRFLEQPLVNNQYTAHNIANNFRTLKRRVDNMKSEGEKESLLEYVKNSCEFIVVITNNISEAFQFFDSQNTRDKKLYPHDLLKAYHLREMSHMDVDETEKIVKAGRI